MTYVLSDSEFVRHQMMSELAADEMFLGYEHDPEEIARVVSGLAVAACDTQIEYLATSEDVRAVAEYVAYSLGVDDFEMAGALARTSFLEQERPRVVS